MRFGNWATGKKCSGCLVGEKITPFRENDSFGAFPSTGTGRSADSVSETGVRRLRVQISFVNGFFHFSPDDTTRVPVWNNLTWRRGVSGHESLQCYSRGPPTSSAFLTDCTAGFLRFVWPRAVSKSRQPYARVL